MSFFDSACPQANDQPATLKNRGNEASFRSQASGLKLQSVLCSLIPVACGLGLPPGGLSGPPMVPVRPGKAFSFTFFCLNTDWSAS